MNARPDHRCQTSGRWFWITILALRRRASGRDTTSSGRLIDLPFLGTWEEIWNWSSTERRPDVLLKRPDGCKPDRTFSTQWRVRTERHVVRTDGTMTDGRPDGMAWSSGRLTGNWKSSDSEAFLNSRIPVEHRYTQVILSKHRMRPKY
jgi:hypothetical protein